MDMDFSIGGYNIKGWMVAVALPVLSAVSGTVYFAYDTLNRFYDVESGLQEVLDIQDELGKTITNISSRLQTVEQAIQDNDVRGLSEKLSAISTNMQTILEQQKALLDLRSQVEKSTTITDGLGDKLDTYQQEIEDLWKAYDELYENPLGN